MTQDQIAIVVILIATVAAFVWGRWRHDMVAVGALLACVAAGLVPATDAFLGFGHPAVITVACVLVLGSGLQSSGAVDAVTRAVLPRSSRTMVNILALTVLGTALSAFMNNVAALALLMPVGVQIASRQGLPPGKVLMPLAFGSILGGMTTLIGTPPNLIVSSFRFAHEADGFAMFDFTPVGASVAVMGLVFVVLFSRWLVPARERAGAESFETGAYLTEARVGEKSKAAGMTLHDVDKTLEEADAQVIGLVRDEVRIPAPNPFREIRQGDILVIEADPEGLGSALSALGLKLEEEVAGAAAEKTGESPSENGDGEPRGTDGKDGENGDTDKKKRRAIQSDEVVLMEMAVLPDSGLAGRSATDIRLRTRYGINLLAVSRQGRRSLARLRTMAIHPGDVLLMQGAPEALNELASNFGCVPLAKRPLRIPDPRRALTSAGILVAAIGGAAFGLVPAAISFAAGVLASMALRVVSLRNVYNAIDWPVVVLLAALIPVAGAMVTTGAADSIARLLVEGIARGHAIAALALILVVTMTLSDVMNNAATAAVMCPIAIGTADRLAASADPFLMAVAIGASCAFLTPIGHQNNTLILGPGGFGFGDYWRLGLPLEVIAVAVAVPMLLLAWPL